MGCNGVELGVPSSGAGESLPSEHQFANLFRTSFAPYQNG